MNYRKCPSEASFNFIECITTASQSMILDERRCDLGPNQLRRFHRPMLQNPPLVLLLKTMGTNHNVSLPKHKKPTGQRSSSSFPYIVAFSRPSIYLQLTPGDREIWDSVGGDTPFVKLMNIRETVAEKVNMRCVCLPSFSAKSSWEDLPTSNCIRNADGTASPNIEPSHFSLPRPVRLDSRSYGEPSVNM